MAATEGHVCVESLTDIVPAGSSQANADEKSVRSFLYDNPGFVTTVIFIILNVIGLASSTWVFYKFGLNYFDFAEVSDLLISAFRRIIPTTVILCIAIVMAVVFFWKHKTPKVRYLLSMLVGITTVGIILALAFANVSVHNIRENRAAVYDVCLTRERETPPAQRASSQTALRGSIVGRTGDVVVLYMLDNCSVRVIPKAAIRSMTYVRNAAGNFELAKIWKSPPECDPPDADKPSKC